MGKVMVNESSLQDIASAIREKTEGAETYKPSEMGAAIRALKNGAELADAPKITYNGKWMPWRIEFYAGVPYWEAWFFTSGTLTVADGESYVCDAWGIGGGGSTYWSTGGSTGMNVGSGRTGLRQEQVLTGNVAVTIGAGGNVPTSGSRAGEGGATKLGSDVVGDGGVKGASPISADGRYRFFDPDKANEAGAGASNEYNSFGGGWLPISSGTNPNVSGYIKTQGFGSAAPPYSTGVQGALVLRILA